MRNVAIVAASLVVVGCELPPPPQPANDVVAPASAEVLWRPVEPVTDGVIVSAVARVVTAAEAGAHVTPAVSAVVRKIHVMPGDRVDVGRVVAEFSSPRLAEAAALAVGAGSRLTVLRRRMKQLAGLRAAGLAQRNALFEIELALAVAEAERRGALAILRGAMVDDGALSSLAERGVWSVKAPITGLVTEVNGQPGYAVGPEDEPIVRLQKLAPARIEALLPSVPPVDVGARFIAADGSTLALQSEPVSAVVDSGSGMWRLWIDPKVPESLPPGLQGTIQFLAGGPTVAVPTSSVLCDDAGCWLRRLRKGEAKLVNVQRVWANGATAVVRGDLSTSDRVAKPQEMRR